MKEVDFHTVPLFSLSFPLSPFIYFFPALIFVGNTGKKGAFVDNVKKVALCILPPFSLQYPNYLIFLSLSCFSIISPPCTSCFPTPLSPSVFLQVGNAGKREASLDNVRKVAFYSLPPFLLPSPLCLHIFPSLHHFCRVHWEGRSVHR